MAAYVFLVLFFCGIATAVDVQTTQVFVLPITPPMFNWTSYGSEFVFKPSLYDAPDLPSWVHYQYSEKRKTGFLYGVPPKDVKEVDLEIVGMNRNNYETGRILWTLDVREKENPAKYEVQLKVNNLNVEDVFDNDRLKSLMDVFRKRLWGNSNNDLYVTFLASAVDLGARLPLKPSEEEGVVLRLGSRSEFSDDLKELQMEVSSLWNLNPCPREFKRTTVERLFRDRNFVVDWCTFQLFPDEILQPTQHVEQSYLPLRPPDTWYTFRRSEIPQRSYTEEFSLTILLPMLVMLVLILFLSLILCFHHEGMDDDASEHFDAFFDVFDEMSSKNTHTPPVQMVQYSSVRRASDTLRTLSTKRDSVLPGAATARTYLTSEYTGTYPRTSTPSFYRQSEERTPLNRPDPPPYMGSQRNGITRKNYLLQ